MKLKRVRGGVGFRCCFSPFFVKINKERLEK